MDDNVVLSSQMRPDLELNVFSLSVLDGLTSHSAISASSLRNQCQKFLCSSPSSPRLHPYVPIETVFTIKWGTWYQKLLWCSLKKRKTTKPTSTISCILHSIVVDTHTAGTSFHMWAHHLCTAYMFMSRRQSISGPNCILELLCTLSLEISL